jgi:hypothetical protein
MDPITTTSNSTAISQLIIQLVSTVGVGNFVVIMFVMMLVANAPTIIDNIASFFKGKKYNKNITDLLEKSTRVEQYLESLKSEQEGSKKNINIIINEVKALVSIIDVMHSSLEKENNERREENILITNSLERLSSALEAIERTMRNVISENDSAELISLILGIKINLRESILKNVIEPMIDIIEENGIEKKDLEKDLKNDLYSEWSDFITEINLFNMPVNMSSFLNAKEKVLWTDGGLFDDVVKLALTDRNKLSKARKKTTIVKRLNIGLRQLHTEMNNILHQERNNSQY